MAKSVTDALIAWGELKVREDALGRDAEEREWQEEALFYQRRQWLEWKEGERRFVQVKTDKKKPRPMPVSNYFANTVNTNANSLQRVRVLATPKNDDTRSRRAADYAEMAKDVIDEESNFLLLLPLLSKHTALWGMGITRDDVDTSEDPSEMNEDELQSSHVIGCIDCGQVNETEPSDGTEDGYSEQQNMPCPSCGSMQTMAWTRNQATTATTYVTGKGKIKTRVVPVFEVYLPRDVQNPNLSPRIIHRYRRPISAIKAKWGDQAKDIKADDAATNTSETRMDILRGLSGYTFAEKAGAETGTLTEVWVKWDALPERLQDAIEDELEPDDDEDEDQETPELTPEDLDSMKKYGMFFIYAQGNMLQWGPNTNVDPDTEECFNPFTFYLWDIDPASVYPKGIGADLIPLQKRLNRLDSLIELAMMTNAVGKWLWPTTQNNMKPPNGDPSDVVGYDPLGDGKIKPEFVVTQPISGQAWQYRAAILQDFEKLGLTLGIQQGQAQGEAFRTVAYLGAKASEALNTQRFLWETAHCLRYRKTLAMAKLYWDDERQAKIAGPNGRFMFEAFIGDDLRGMYEIGFVPNSSIPKTADEKMQMLEQMLTIGLVDITDPATRQYLYDFANMEGINLASEMQFRKAERDLETIKHGEVPIESPYQDWNIALKTFANFTLSEQFEELAPELQTFVLAYTEYLNQKMIMVQEQTMLQGMAAQMGPAVAKTMAPGLGGKQPADPNNKTLAKIPGKNISPAGSERAATSQGNNFAHAMGA
jgi:hypothetical protein